MDRTQEPICLGTYYFSHREILQICAPCPYSYVRSVTVELQARVESAVQCIVPRTVTKATLYGKGSVRLKESSSGSTAGSPSIIVAVRKAALSGSGDAQNE